MLGQGIITNMDKYVTQVLHGEGALTQRQEHLILDGVGDFTSLDSSALHSHKIRNVTFVSTEYSNFSRCHFLALKRLLPIFRIT